MTQFKSLNIIALSLLLLASSTLFAGQIFRFQDESGITTMSKVLPPYAAQAGYDILDDKSFRLIEHVDPALTPEQIIEEEKNIAAEEEKKRLADLAKEELKEQQRQQAIYDNNLRASYGSEQELLNARDTELTYLNNLLDKSKTHRTKRQEDLLQLQKNAADTELSGKKVTANQQKRINAAQQEIANDDLEIERLEREIQQRSLQFDTDLKRLQELLSH